VTRETDIAVIGAGAAGLAAGLALAGRASFEVLEAAPHRGGRAVTDTKTLGVPFDLGCHWLHDARANPFLAIAEQLGFAVGRTPGRRRRLLQIAGRRASQEESDEAADAVDAAFDAVRRAGEAGRDVAASSVLPFCGPFTPLARHWLSLMTAAAPEAISARDFALYRDTDDNWPVLDGYGALVAANAATVPVRLDCPVRRIDRSGARLRLETAQGVLEAGAVIVTVSTAVIAEGGLLFTPELPEELEAAFAALPLGAAEKVAVLFDRDVFGVPPRTAIDIIPMNGGVPASALLNPGGAPAAVVHLAGPVAGALAKAGEAALVEAALAALEHAFGGAIRAHLVRARATAWAAMPFIGGGYSCALPGHAEARTRITRLVSEGLDGRLFFAGEALAGPAFSTCHGAHRTGLAAAEAALKALA